MKTEYRQADILKVFPWIKRQTLMSWSRMGLLQAEYGEARGTQGIWRSYSYDNLLEIALISEFTYNGVNPRSLMLVIEEYRLAIRRGAFDRVFFIGRTKGRNGFSIRFADASESEFDRYTTNGLFFDPNWKMSSFTAISLRSLKEYVDREIQGL